MAAINPKRGEIWTIRFDPPRGDEIKKQRRAIVMNIEDAGRLALRMVVPITTGNLGFRRHFWMVEIPAAKSNGLDHDSFADTFQFKSVSIERFVSRIGVLTDTRLMHEITSAIVLCIGHRLQ
jgi:mRNA interferase MazF